MLVLIILVFRVDPRRKRFSLKMIFLIVQCRSLEKIGYESLVIVASQDSHTEMGSERGRYFIDCFDLVVEFLKFCQGKNIRFLRTRQGLHQC